MPGVRLVAIILSIALSVWACIHNDVINPDAICYLQSAENMPYGLQHAMQLCDQAKWPFYSIVIFILSHVTSFSSLISAYILNGFLSLVSVISFIAIVCCLNGNRNNKTVWFAAVVILLAHEFNAIRDSIVRDHGFLAFYLVSILFLLRFFQFSYWRYAIAWGVSLIIATLFRIEGIFFLATLPFIVFIDNRFSFQQRIFSFFKLNFLNFLSILFLLSWMQFHPQQSLVHAGRMDELKFQVLNSIGLVAHNFNNHAQVLAENMMSQYSLHEASLVFFLVLVFWYLISIIQNLSIPYFILFIYACRKKLLTNVMKEQWVLGSYILINILVTFIFLAEHMFLSKRYLLALSLTCMLWVPFALNALSEQWQMRRWPMILAVFFIVFYSLGGIFDFGYSKRYIRNAGEWVEVNVPKNKSFYSNDYQVMYYSKHFGDDIFIRAKEFLKENSIDESKLKYYDYFALRFDNKQQEKLALIKKEFGVPLTVYTNKRGDQVIIYKRNPS